MYWIGISNGRRQHEVFWTLNKMVYIWEGVWSCKVLHNVKAIVYHYFYFISHPEMPRCSPTVYELRLLQHIVYPNWNLVPLNWKHSTVYLIASCNFRSMFVVILHYNFTSDSTRLYYYYSFYVELMEWFKQLSSSIVISLFRLECCVCFWKHRRTMSSNIKI